MGVARKKKPGAEKNLVGTRLMTHFPIIVPVVVSGELLVLRGGIGRSGRVPAVLRDAGVGLDDHAELQVLALVHLDREALVGEPWGQLRGHPDVGLVCREKVPTELDVRMKHSTAVTRNGTRKVSRRCSSLSVFIRGWVKRNLYLHRA